MRSTSTERLVWVLPESLRTELSEPLDRILDAHEYLDALRRAPLGVTVGDVVTATALENGVKPALSIVDGKTKRKEEGRVWSYESSVWNPPGCVTFEAMLRIYQLLEKGQVTTLFVDGEEDLLVIPVILLSRDGTLVCYGQPDRGVVCITVNKTKRHLALDVFRRMEVRIL
jgi:uncharacterized protein (UPF0218 family)